MPGISKILVRCPQMVDSLRFSRRCFAFPKTDVFGWLLSAREEHQITPTKSRFCTTGNDRVYITAHVGDISTLSLLLDYNLGSVNGGRRFPVRPFPFNFFNVYKTHLNVPR